MFQRPEKMVIVSVLDPAIDTEAMTPAKMADYIRTRDYSLLKFKPGIAPTRFHIREVPHALWESFIMNGTNDADRSRRCFMAGVEKVENLYGKDGVAQPDYTPMKVSGTEVMSEDTLVRFSPAEREEIGAVVWGHSFLPTRIEPTYRLPPSVRAILVERPFLLADPSQSPPAPSSETASSPSGSAPQQPSGTGTTSSSSAADSGGPTVATVQVTPN